MKKYFEIIGFLVLALFSFYYTSKTTTVIKNTDDIMIKIKDDMDNYRCDAIDAIIKNDTIIPGLSGKEVDISKSYDAMKKVGSYIPSMLVYKNIKPNVSISNIYDKYIIGGNSTKGGVSLIFKVDEKDDLGAIIDILNKNEVKANIFTKDNLSDNILNLVKEGFDIGSVSNETWAATLIDKIANQKYNFCYLEEENKEVLDICSMNKRYTILPSIITSNTPTLTIKKNLDAGSIISMDVNNNLLRELEYIIRYIKSRGYNIVNLETLLEE